MISKGVNNRCVWFVSITGSGKGCNEHCMLCQTLEQKDFETFLAGQAVLQPGVGGA